MQHSRSKQELKTFRNVRVIYDISAAYTSSPFIHLQTTTFRSKCVCDEGGLSTGSILLIVYVLNMGLSVRPCRYGDAQEFIEHTVEQLLACQSQAEHALQICFFRALQTLFVYPYLDRRTLNMKQFLYNNHWQLNLCPVFPLYFDFGIKSPH